MARLHDLNINFITVNRYLLDDKQKLISIKDLSNDTPNQRRAWEYHF